MKLSDPGLLKTQAYVDGAWIDADSGATQPVINPATGETIIEIAKCGTAETRRAIEAADKALESHCDSIKNVVVLKRSGHDIRMQKDASQPQSP